MKRWMVLVGAAALSLVVVAGVLTAGASSSGQGEPPPNLDAAYIGSFRCISCHNAEGSELWTAWHQTFHARGILQAEESFFRGDFGDEDALTIIWPGGEERPITPEDITYIIDGNYTQQYIAVMERDSGEEGYFVLPVVWNDPQSEDQVGLWTPYHPDDWMEPERDWRMACSGCHTTGQTAAKLSAGPNYVFAGAEVRSDDVEFNIGCEACHGPGGEHDGGENPMPRTPDAAVCGQCHTQGHDPSGDHPFPLDYQPGLSLEDAFVLTSFDDEAIFWANGQARKGNSQYNEWLETAHAGAFSALMESDLAEDACLRCHVTPADATDPSPDFEYTLEDAPVGVTCVTCHNPHPAESAPRNFELGGALGEVLLRHDASPHETAVWQSGQPGEGVPFLLQDDEYALCVSCHNSATAEGETLRVGDMLHYPVQEMFEGANIIDGVEGIPAPHFTLEDGPRCVTCHMTRSAAIGEFGAPASHRFAAVMPGEAADMQPDSCTACHAEVVTVENLQRLIDDVQASIAGRLEAAQAASDGADAWVLDALALVEGDGSLGVHNYNYADALLDAVEEALGLVQEAEAEPSTAPFVGEPPAGE